jgi:hypothetical protein
MSLSLIITIVIAVYALVMAIIYLTAATKRSWIMSVIRLIITVVSAVAAMPLTKALAELGSETVYEFLLPRLGDKMGGFLTAVPVGAEGMRVVAALLVSPALFLAVFLILRWLLSVIVWIVEKCTPKLRRRTKRFLSVPLGALNGFLIAGVTLIPLCGYLMFGAHLLNTFVDSGMTDTTLVRENVLKPFKLTEDELEKVADRIEKQPLLSVLYQTVGKPVYEELTIAELDASATHGQTVEINLNRELSGLLVTAACALDVSESFDKEEYTPADKELLFTTADSFFKSEWIRLLAADTLVAMSDTWLENQAFAGMDRPALDESLNPTLNRLLEVLASETPDTLEEDIHIILDIVGDLLIHDLLEEEADYTAMVQRMGQSGLLSDMLAKLEQNQRMHALAAELKALSIRLVSNMLGAELLKGGEYTEMMGNVADSLNNVLDMPEEERNSIITQSIKNNFSEKGFDVPDDVALEMSNQLINDLGADGEITADELTDYMVNHAEEGFDIMGDVEIPEELPDLQP